MIGARRRAALLAAAGVLAISLAAATPRPTVAAWADTEVATGASLGAGTVAPVVTMTCTPGGLGVATRFSWTAPSGGLSRGGYRWIVTGTLTGSGTRPASATFVDLPTGLLGIGSGTFSLYAVGPGGWESAPKTGSLAYLTAILATCSVP